MIEHASPVKVCTKELRSIIAQIPTQPYHPETHTHVNLYACVCWAYALHAHTLYAQCIYLICLTWLPTHLSDTCVSHSFSRSFIKARSGMPQMLKTITLPDSDIHSHTDHIRSAACTSQCKGMASFPASLASSSVAPF